jgi:hypothetical protein
LLGGGGGGCRGLRTMIVTMHIWKGQGPMRIRKGQGTMRIRKGQGVTCTSGKEKANAHQERARHNAHQERARGNNAHLERTGYLFSAKIIKILASELSNTFRDPSLGQDLPRHVKTRFQSIS